MNILGMGIWELLLIMIIAMVVAGPQRLLRWAYLAGRFFAQVRVVWGRVMEDVQREFDEAGVDVHLPKDPSNRQQMRRFAQEALRPIREPMQQAMQDYEEERRRLNQELKGVQDEVKGSSQDAAIQGPAPRPEANNGSSGSASPDQGTLGTWSSVGKD